MALSQVLPNLLLILWANVALGFSPLTEELETLSASAFTCDHSAESSSPPISCPIPTEDEDRDEEEDDGKTETEGLKAFCANTLQKCSAPPHTLEKAWIENMGRPPKNLNV